MADDEEMAGKAPVEIIVDGKNINDMQWPALQKHIVGMTDALILERGERTRIRKECVKIRTCWEGSEKEYDEKKGKLVSKYFEKGLLWDKYIEPYAEKEQEITYQKYILNFDMNYQEKERRKTFNEIKEKWDKLVLPKMMEANTLEAQRFDKKQKESNKEFVDVKLEYQRSLDETIKVLDEKLLDWKEDLSKRIAIRKRYNHFQFLLRQLCYSEQKNLLIHDLNAGYKVDFEKIRDLMRERIEGDMLLILALTEEINKYNESSETARIEIEQYKVMNDKKLEEFNKLDKHLGWCELRLTSYKQNIDKALRCSKRVEKLKKEKDNFEKRKQQLELEVNKRLKEKQKYVDILKLVKTEMSALQTSLFGEDFNKLLDGYKEDIKEFNELYSAYEKCFPEKARFGKEQYLREQAMLKELPFLITRELKGHNDFIQSAMERMVEIGLAKVPTFVRLASDTYPTGSGPAGLVYT